MYRTQLRNAIVALFAAASMSSAIAANIIIDNADLPGEGLNDPTIVSPVAGNPGTTLGAQRQYALQAAANYWGAKLRSSVDIHIAASFVPMSCPSGAGQISFSDGSANYVANVYAGSLINYPVALANALIGTDINGSSPELGVNFNPEYDRSCNPLILGIWNGVPPTTAPAGYLSLFEAAVAEFARSLGFESRLDRATGEFPMGIPTRFSQWVYDQYTGEYLSDMTREQRLMASAYDPFVWGGINVYARQGEYLHPQATLTITAPTAVAASYMASRPVFGPDVSAPGLNGTIVAALDAADSRGSSATDGCSPISNASEVSGHIALIDRGTCPFTTKVLNAQIAGAIAVVVANNTPTPELITAYGSSMGITIPMYFVTQATGAVIRAQLPTTVVAARLGYSDTELEGTNGGLIRLNGLQYFASESRQSYDSPLALWLLRDLGWELTDSTP